MARLSRSSPTCARAARVSLAAFMDAVVIADPVQNQRRRDERDDVSMSLKLDAFQQRCRVQINIPPA
jgi:hypothetical protein